MSRLKLLFTKTLLFHLWQEFRVRYRFKYVLPRVTETTLDGIRLDLSPLSLKVRNRILMGIYESHEKAMCEDFLTPKDSVLEIGGAIGFIGLVCQKKIGILNYYIVEANPETLEVLCSNYLLNGLRPTAWNLALGPSDGPLQLDVASDFWENSVVTPGEGGSSEKTVEVQGASFGSLLKHVGRKVNALIIDVEGAEQYIDVEAIPEEVDKIIIELHPKVVGARATYDLIARLIQRGFYVAREEGGTFAFLKQSMPATTVVPRPWNVEETELLGKRN